MQRLLNGRAIGLAGVVTMTVMLAAGELLDRDQRRIDRAQETYEADLERAWDQFVNRVDRAQRNLTRTYEPVINQYERRGDAAIAGALQRELDELVDLREIIVQLANVDLDEKSDGDDDEEDSEDDGNNEGSYAALIQAIGPALVFGNGRVVETKGLTGAEYVVLYFSAGWCGPCRVFTPDLIDFYRQHKGGELFEIVFVSSDRSPQDFVEYFRDSNMPWPAIPYERVDASGIKQTFGRGAIPHLVVFDTDGNVILSTHDQNRRAVLENFAGKLDVSGD